MHFRILPVFGLLLNVVCPTYGQAAQVIYHFEGNLSDLSGYPNGFFSGSFNITEVGNRYVLYNLDDDVIVNGNSASLEYSTNTGTPISYVVNNSFYDIFTPQSSGYRLYIRSYYNGPNYKNIFSPGISLPLGNGTHGSLTTLWIENSQGKVAVSSSGVITSYASKAPSALEYARFSDAVYRLTPSSIDGYRYIGDNFSIDHDQYAGLHAAAYVSNDGSQVVVAFRGTVAQANRAGVKTFLADESFASGIPTPDLQRSLQNASMFLAKIREEYPYSTITLTGHSLGGSIAEILSAHSGLKATVFDAPGAAHVNESAVVTDIVRPYFSPSSSLGTIVDYRAADDQFSRVGQQFIGTQTVSLPDNSPYHVTGSHFYDLIHNFGSILANHSISLLVDELAAGVTPFLGYNGTDLHFNDITNPISASLAALTFSFYVEAHQIYALDPSGGSVFKFVQSASSPFLESILLPQIGNVTGYQVSFLQDGSWSPYSFVSADDVFDVGPDVLGFEFDPRNAFGLSTNLPSSFLFGVSYKSAGTVNASLTVPSVPLPGTLSLSGLSLLMLSLFSTRRGKDRPIRIGRLTNFLRKSHVRNALGALGCCIAES